MLTSPFESPFPPVVGAVVDPVVGGVASSHTVSSASCCAAAFYTPCKHIASQLYVLLW